MECGDKSLDIDFGDSDDEEEEEEKQRRVKKGEHGTLATSRSRGLGDVGSHTAAGGGMSRVGGARKMEDGQSRPQEEVSDDEGFCVVDAPTSTYVVCTTV